MVQVGDMWVDIYQTSAAQAVTQEAGVALGFIAAGIPQSKYGQLPITGTELMTWYGFTELAGRVGKRMMSYSEWCRQAYGNPGGQAASDDYGWTKTANTARTRTGCNVDPITGLYSPGGGIKPYAVSAYNTVDSVGNVYEWASDLIGYDGNGYTYTWRNIVSGGENKGQLYTPNVDDAFRAFLCGGGWNNGVDAGPRCAATHGSPWGVAANNGCRLACDKLSA